MNEPKAARPRRKRLLNLLLLLILLLLAALLVAMYLADQPPAFYQTASERDTAKLTRDAYDFSRKAQDFGSAVWSKRDRALKLTADEINGYLAAVNDDAIWSRLPMKFEAWRKMFTSETMRNVQVALGKGTVTVAGEITWAGYKVVMSVMGTPEVDEEGRVRFHVRGVRVGRLPLPGFLFSEIIARIESRRVPAKASRWKVVSIDLHDGKAVLTGQSAED